LNIVATDRQAVRSFGSNGAWFDGRMISVSGRVLRVVQNRIEARDVSRGILLLLFSRPWKKEFSGTGDNKIDCAQKQCKYE
jgi:hypothetical protein